MHGFHCCTLASATHQRSAVLLKSGERCLHWDGRHHDAAPNPLVPNLCRAAGVVNKLGFGRSHDMNIPGTGAGAWIDDTASLVRLLSLMAVQHMVARPLH